MKGVEHNALKRHSKSLPPPSRPNADDKDALTDRNSAHRYANRAKGCFPKSAPGILLLLCCTRYYCHALIPLSSLSVQTSTTSRYAKSTPGLFSQSLSEKDSVDRYKTSTDPSSRRNALISIASAAVLLPAVAQAAVTTGTGAITANEPLENVLIGHGQWKPLDRAQVSAGSSGYIPAVFCTYAARFLIHYDSGVNDWWQTLQRDVSLLPDDKQRQKMGRSFGSLAKSVELAFDPYLEKRQDPRESYQKLFDLFMERYGSKPDAKRHIGLLFATLPVDQQPLGCLSSIANRSPFPPKASANDLATTQTLLSGDLAALLPAKYQACAIDNNSAFAILPQLSLYEVGIDEEFGQTATATTFGPLAAVPLTRELPSFSSHTYTLFGISGATGCALTHSVVIPLDVVKTRAQTNPDQYKGVVDAAVSIASTEGVGGLLLGAQATLAGYFWYGLSVYPCYTLFKRSLAQTVLSPEVAMAHSTEIALVAGALASVVASFGLTPLEAARIRAVAEPETYRELGVIGTLRRIANEDPQQGWRATYAGLPSLLTRQVIFGSVKFLAFERACEAIFTAMPSLRDATWTALGVSLLAGAFSGALSSVVSQPADSVLTYVARNSSGRRSSLGVIEGSMVMIEKEGVSALFRGLGSRSIWASSIIAGQFLLYDVFRTYFGVNADDLSQVYEVILPNIN